MENNIRSIVKFYKQEHKKVEENNNHNIKHTFNSERKDKLIA